MKKYVGPKMMEANLMIRGEYNGCRGWSIPQKGYLEGIPCNKQTAKVWGMNEEICSNVTRTCK